MPRKPEPKAEDIRRIMVPMPDSLHRKVKMAAAEKRMTMVEILRQAIERGLPLVKGTA
jgi:hypothetical protein